MKKKQWISIILSSVMIATSVPSYTALAEKSDMDNVLDDGSTVVYDEEVRSTTDTLEDLPDNDELFGQYVDRLFFGDHSISTFGNYGEDKLEGVDLKAYQILKENIQKIAAGEQESTVISISLEELGIKTTWTASELGVDSIISSNISSNSISEETQKAISALFPDTGVIADYLRVNCPYELYWFDKTIGYSVGTPGFSYSSTQVSFDQKAELTCSFRVAKEYRKETDNQYLVNTEIAQTTKTAVNNAKNIVTQYSSLGDYDKLVNYKKEICNLVSYNQEAVDQDMDYGNPWQLIWVFDDDPSTNVVCEGYSKAFQYLCDLTEFSNPNIKCYTVTGTMAGGTGAGGHMWNVVTMQDNKNYIVDVTNCDEGTIGSDDKLFLSGVNGDVSSGYIADIEGQHSITYTYDSDIVNMYGDILKLSSSKYDPTLITTPTDTPSATPTESPVATPTDTPSATPTESPVATPTDTPSATPTGSPVATPTDTPSATPTGSPVATPTDTPSATPTGSPVATPTDTPSATPTGSPVATPTDTPSATPTGSPVATPTDTPSATPTGSPVATPTDTPSATPTGSPVATPTDTPSVTPTGSPVTTPTDTPSVTPTESPIATPTDMPSVTPTESPVATPTDTPSVTPTGSPVATPTDTPSTTPTGSPVTTPTDTPSATPTGSPVATPTDTPSTTPTGSPVTTPTDTPSATPTGSPVATPTDTPSATPTGSPVATPTDTPSATPTESPVLTPTPTVTVEKNEDGSTTEITVTTEENKNGDIIKTTKIVHKDASGKITSSSINNVIAISPQDNGSTITINVTKDGKGKITDATANISVGTSTGGQKALIQGSMVKQITKTAGTTKVDINIKGQDHIYTVIANTSDLTAGKKLNIVQKKADGTYILVNAKTYTVTKDGDIFASINGNKTYEFINLNKMNKLSSSILKTIKVKKPSKTVKKSKTTKMTLKNTLKMANVKSIKYTVSKKKVAKVNKQGIITGKKAGTTVVRAKITLKNGKTKTVKMKVTVKK